MPLLRLKMTGVWCLGLWLSSANAVCPSVNIFAGDMEADLPASPAGALLSENDAARFLHQATYGPNIKEIRRLQRLGYDAWLDRQMARPVTLQQPCMQRTLDDPNLPLYQNSRLESWYLNSAQGADQLRQRMAFALSQIFVVSDNAALGNEVMGIARYYDLLASMAFDNYRDVLEQVTRNVVMGQYLGMFKNAKADPVAGTQPDENYAREVMQLFSIGLHQLNMDGTEILDGSNNPIPTYDQTVIENFARAFTGWNYAGCASNNWTWCNPSQPGVDGYAPMEPNEAYHDTDPKTLLNGQAVPGGQNAHTDLDAALDNIFNHPNVPPFISKQLIQRFVTSNPSPAYVGRVSAVFADNGSGVRGDLNAVIRAVLLGDEARNNSFIDNSDFGKLKEPIIRQVSLWRAFNAISPNQRFQIWNPEFPLAQRPLGAPSVFNFYKPGFRQPGPIRDANLVSPEFQITSETTVFTVTNEINEMTTRGHHLYNHWNDGWPLLQLQAVAALYDSDGAAFLDHLDLLMFAGQMTAHTRTVLEDLMNQLQSSSAVQKAASVILVLALSPEYVVQR